MVHAWMALPFCVVTYGDPMACHNIRGVSKDKIKIHSFKMLFFLYKVNYRHGKNATTTTTNFYAIFKGCHNFSLR